MTSKDYRTIQELLTNSDICDFADRMCQKGEINPCTDYPQNTGSEVMLSSARRHMYLSRAIDLLRRMIFLGATGLEVLRVSEYIMVLMRSISDSLDYKRCEKALKIGDLERKYSRESFFDLEEPVETWEYVIKRDKGYYPVPIKVVKEEKPHANHRTWL